MSGLEGFTKFEKNYLCFFLGLLIFAFFYQLGIYPLFLEEPRRGLIALEMIHRDNLWVPTQTGDLYLRKPPFYNWVLILSYKIFGQTEFATRFFSVLSHLLLGCATFYFSKRYLNHFQAVLISFSYLLCADILVYFSTLGEIDLFYAFITGTSLFLIYHFGEQKKYYLLFISVYLITAIGFLTKGLSSLPYTAISLLVYFIWSKDFKRLFSLAHVLGVLVFLVVLVGYFYKYSQFEEVSGWWATLYSESADKAAGGGIKEWFSHLITFPLDNLKNLLPATLLLPLIFTKGNIHKLKENRFIWFSLLIFGFNVLVYWLSSEGRSRYIYPVFPFACIVIVYLFVRSETYWKDKYLHILSIILLTILILGFSILPFLQQLEQVDNLVFITVLGVTLLVVVLMFLLKKKVRSYLVILGLFCVLRLVFSFIVLQTREKTTGAAEDKELGIELAEITKGEPLHRLGDVRMSLSIVFYLERDRGDILYQAESFSSGFYFSYLDDLPESGYELVKQFDYHDQPIFLVKYIP